MPEFPVWWVGHKGTTRKLLARWLMPWPSRMWCMWAGDAPRSRCLHRMHPILATRSMCALSAFLVMLGRFQKFPLITIRFLCGLETGVVTSPVSTSMRRSSKHKLCSFYVYLKALVIVCPCVISRMTFRGASSTLIAIAMAGWTGFHLFSQIPIICPSS